MHFIFYKEFIYFSVWSPFTDTQFSQRWMNQFSHSVNKKFWWSFVTPQPYCFLQFSIHGELNTLIVKEVKIIGHQKRWVWKVWNRFRFQFHKNLDGCKRCVWPCIMLQIYRLHVMLNTKHMFTSCFNVRISHRIYCGPTFQIMYTYLESQNNVKSFFDCGKPCGIPWSVSLLDCNDASKFCLPSLPLFCNLCFLWVCLTLIVNRVWFPSYTIMWVTHSFYKSNWLAMQLCDATVVLN